MRPHSLVQLIVYSDKELNYITIICVTGVFDLPVVPQSWRRTVEPSRSRRRSSAARARLWSARVTVVTPLCTSAGTATPACPWWTLVLLWRYSAVFVCLPRLLSPRISLLLFVAVETCGCLVLHVGLLLSSPQAKDHWSNVLCLTFLFMSVFVSFSLLCLHPVYFLSSPSISLSFCRFSSLSIHPETVRVH